MKKLSTFAWVQVVIWGILILASQLLSHPTGNVEQMLVSPNLAHLFGTDSLGRDLFLRLILGTKNTIVVGLGALVLSLVISVFIGWLMTSYKWIADVASAIVGAFQVMPNLIWILFFASLLKNIAVPAGTLELILLLALCNWTGGAVLVANQIRVTRVQDYVLAAHAIGAKSWQVMFYHIWPNIKTPVWTHSLFLFSSLIIQESTISFLGLGLSSPNESWGTIMLEGWRSLSVSPHLALAPTFFILAANWSLLSIFRNRQTAKENFQELALH